MHPSNKFAKITCISIQQRKMNYARTFPSLAKCFSSSLLVTRSDNPVTYRLLPGFSTSHEGLLSARSQKMRIRTIECNKRTEQWDPKGRSMVNLRHYLDFDLDLDTDTLYRLYREGEREYLEILQHVKAQQREKKEIKCNDNCKNFNLISQQDINIP